MGPQDVAVDGAGNLFIVDRGRIRKVTSAGLITTVAGNGTYGFSGDGGPALSAQINAPRNIAVDGVGNLFIADTRNHRIRKVTPAGIITTVAGTGTPGFSGDGGPALSAQINTPGWVTVDAARNLLIADVLNHRIRKVTPAGIITTVAGTATTSVSSGDGAPGLSAQARVPVTTQSAVQVLAGQDKLDLQIARQVPALPTLIAAYFAAIDSTMNQPGRDRTKTELGALKFGAGDANSKLRRFRDDLVRFIEAPDATLSDALAQQMRALIVSWNLTAWTVSELGIPQVADRVAAVATEAKNTILKMAGVTDPVGGVPPSTRVFVEHAAVFVMLLLPSVTPELVEPASLAVVALRNDARAKLDPVNRFRFLVVQNDLQPLAEELKHVYVPPDVARVVSSLKESLRRELFSALWNDLKLNEREMTDAGGGRVFTLYLTLSPVSRNRYVGSNTLTVVWSRFGSSPPAVMMRPSGSRIAVE